MKSEHNSFVSLWDKLKNYDRVIAALSLILLILSFAYACIFGIGITTFVVLFIGLLFGVVFTRLQYKKTKNAKGNEFQKEKVRLEVWLATFGTLAITGVFTIFQLNQAANIAKRQDYRTSIDFLSSASPAVRRKGVDDLYNLAKEKGDYAKEIWGILNDHVKYFTRDKSYQERFPEQPAGDISLILEIQSQKIQSSTDEKNYPFEGRCIDWEFAWLRGAELENAQLQGAILRGSQLQGTNLSNAKLQGADLEGAQLWDDSHEPPNLARAQLQKANLEDAQLKKADLEDAQLQGANLYRAELREADLENAKLQGANLCRANLREADLRGADLKGAILSRAKLRGAKFRRTKLQGANLRYTELLGENLDNKTDLRGVFSSQDPLDTLQDPLNTTPLETWFETVISDQAWKETEMDSVEFKGEMGAVSGTYTEDDAKEWIKEYKEAMGLEDTKDSYRCEP